jgi:hypothetical protein
MTAATDRPGNLAHNAKPRLNPKEASSYLAQTHGLPVAVSTLAKLRTNGGGPPYRKPLRTILYDVTALDAWAADKLGEPVRSTSEAGARQ